MEVTPGALLSVQPVLYLFHQFLIFGWKHVHTSLLKGKSQNGHKPSKPFCARSATPIPPNIENLFLKKSFYENTAQLHHSVSLVIACTFIVKSFLWFGVSAHVSNITQSRSPSLSTFLNPLWALCALCIVRIRPIESGNRTIHVDKRKLRQQCSELSICALCRVCAVCMHYRRDCGGVTGSVKIKKIMKISTQSML